MKKDNRRHSNECQFYITTVQLNSFDGKYVAFGRIVEGMKELMKLNEVETYLQQPKNNIEIVNCGEHIFSL